MNLEDYNKLNEILEDFRQEEAELDLLLEHHLQCIRKADIIINNLIKSESDDYRVFSPRKMEIVHKEEIEQAYKDKSIYEEKNRELYRRKDVIDGRIIMLESVLNRQDYESLISEKDNSETKITQKDKLMREKMIQRISGMLIKLESGIEYMEQNHNIQAKQEFLITKKCMEELIGEIMEDNEHNE